MKIESLLVRLREAPLIVSVQASPKSPLDHEDTLLRLAKASMSQGTKVMRLEGVKSIRHLKPHIGRTPVIGLLKRGYPDCDVYITPAAQDVDALLDLEVEVIAIDGTDRGRPKGDTVASLISRIQRRKSLAMCDCDTLETAIACEAAGADLISTTLAGYTDERGMSKGPDLDLLRDILAAVKIPVIAEGRFTQPWEVQTALRMGAVGVVVGGAINDAVKQTRALFPQRRIKAEETVGAVDIGGTWLRFGVFSEDWKLISSERIANPPSRVDRLQWIREQVNASGVKMLGVSTGGVVDPNTGEVWTAKEYLMPDHIGIRFDETMLGIKTAAHGDGHATAWAHACLPQFAGLRVATLALGTGVGAGFVEENRIWCGRKGEYPRINDLPSPLGKTYEDLLGGLNLTATPTEEQKAAALTALEGAVQAIKDLYFPDVIVISGSVGLSDWLAPHVERLGLVPSPFGTDAGLYGAAALALFPPK